MAARDSVSLGIEALRHELQAKNYLLVIVIYKESFTRESSCTGHFVGAQRVVMGWAFILSPIAARGASGTGGYLDVSFIHLIG